MKYALLMIKYSTVLLVCASVTASAQIQQAWVAKYNNGITNGNHQALKMALDSTGNIYVLGVSANSSSNTGYVTIKYSPNGTVVWTARYDSTNYPSATPTGFALDGSNAVAVTGNAVTLKYDANGNTLWVSSNNAQAIAMDAGQNVYITGVAGKFTTMKLSPQGSNVWTQTWSPTSLSNVGEAVAVDSLGNTCVAGQETVPQYPYNFARMDTLKYDTNGNLLWEANNGSGGITGGVLVVGFILDTNDNIYIEENDLGTSYAHHYQTYGYRPDGPEFMHAGDPTSNLGSASTGLVLDSLGEIVITGENAHYPPLPSYGTYKLNTNGSYLWTNLYPMSSYGPSGALALAVDSANNIYVTGASTITNTGSDIATLKYSPNGNQLWVQRYDGPGHTNDAGNAIAVDNSGNVYVAGYETETNGFTEMVLIKYSPITAQKQSNGNFILQAYGSPGENFDIQASTNLQTWQDIGSVTADTNGLAQFADTNASNFNARFYFTSPQ